MPHYPQPSDFLMKEDINALLRFYAEEDKVTSLSAGYLQILSLQGSIRNRTALNTFRLGSPLQSTLSSRLYRPPPQPLQSSPPATSSCAPPSTVSCVGDRVLHVLSSGNIPFGLNGAIVHATVFTASFKDASFTFLPNANYDNDGNSALAAASHQSASTGDPASASTLDNPSTPQSYPVRCTRSVPSLAHSNFKECVTDALSTSPISPLIPLAIHPITSPSPHGPLKVRIDEINKQIHRLLLHHSSTATMVTPATASSCAISHLRKKQANLEAYVHIGTT